MTQPSNAGKESELSTFSWLELATGFWEEISRILNETQPALNDDAPLSPDANSFNGKFRTYKTWETGIKNLTSLIQMMTRQENQKAASDSMVTFFELLSQVTGDSSENLLEFQKQLLNSISKIGEHTKAYNFDDIDQHIFESSRKLYDSEFKKYLYVPKLGLSRFHLERIAVLIDKFNIHYSDLSELIYLFFVPLEKTSRIMHAKIDSMIKHKDFVENPGAFYNEWIKMLEGHYMKLLQSGEYTEVLKNTIDSLAEYRKSKDEVICQILKDIPIPTNKDMDDVYKELYMVKKQVKELARQLEQINNRP